MKNGNEQHDKMSPPEDSAKKQSGINITKAAAVPTISISSINELSKYQN